MSIQNLLTPLPKKWCDLSCNSINVGDGGANVKAPLNLTGNLTGADAPNAFIDIVPLNTAPNGFNLLLRGDAASGTAQVKLLTQNDPTPSVGLWADAPLSLATFQDTSSILLQISGTNAINCQKTSPGVTTTTIQNIVMPTSGGTASVLNYYEEYVASYIFSGPWGATTYTRNVKAIRIGKNVTLSIDGIFRTGSVAAVITTSTGLPSRFIPPTSTDSLEIDLPVTCVNNGIIVNGNLKISNSGILTISCINGAFPLSYGNFGNTGSVGFNNISTSYSVN